MSMIHIKSKKWNLLFRCIGVILILISSPLVLIMFFKNRDFVGFGFCLFLTLLFLMELSTGLFFRPVCVSISQGSLSYKYYTGNMKLIQFQEIIGYSLSIFGRKGHLPANGVILYLKGGKKLEFTEINLSSINPIIDSLKENDNIQFFGSEKSHASFLPAKYKYKV